MKFFTMEHSPLPILSPIGHKTHLRILFSNILSLRPSLNVKDYVSQPYSTTGCIIVLYVLIFKLREFEKKEMFRQNKNMNFLLYITYLFIEYTFYEFSFV